ncbi:MAG: hypothetical protein KIS91_03250 [Anaerolineae bacterium]|nr:hypothetical protein [Anaerolineae bacterium]
MSGRPTRITPSPVSTRPLAPAPTIELPPWMRCCTRSYVADEGAPALYRRMSKSKQTQRDVDA